MMAQPDVGSCTATQTDAIHLRSHMRHAIGIGDQVVAIPAWCPQISSAAMRLHRRVEVAAGTGRIHCAAIAFFVDVKAVAAARLSDHQYHHGCTRLRPIVSKVSLP